MLYLWYSHANCVIRYMHVTLYDIHLRMLGLFQPRLSNIRRHCRVSSQSKSSSKSSFVYMYRYVYEHINHVYVCIYIYIYICRERERERERDRYIGMGMYQGIRILLLLPTICTHNNGYVILWVPILYYTCTYIG